ncbi:phosphonate C-P lyase system protein PhnG [Alsobacter sp. SYSU M60028]|uniref:Phosphonate C-P lyase system protein PhnG n=1 Tax=Alsobacter ponti TaxID=2962936 RepID=A0ABT1L7C6_9HYPH|nr:phosphonate C-P lyase system protein PhnG [Alsobacter ponti]MCP8937360.1 phosphonate C-P lyase system protein PhnG [Alsobacter ponti]
MTHASPSPGRADAEPVVVARRRAVMALTSRATEAELAAALDRVGRPAFDDIRAPQTGLVMLRGRTGGDGAPFNLGEATVTRSAVRLASGEVGIAYALGRDAAKVRLAAVLDALAQQDAPGLDEALAPVATRLAGQQDLAEARSAATRVDFFTLVRGED